MICSVGCVGWFRWTNILWYRFEREWLTKEDTAVACTEEERLLNAKVWFAVAVVSVVSASCCGTVLSANG